MLRVQNVIYSVSVASGVYKPKIGIKIFTKHEPGQLAYLDLVVSLVLTSTDRYK